MKKIQRLSVLCALLILGGAVTACGSDNAVNDTPAETEQTTEAETEEAWYQETDLPDTDWGGKDFHVLGWNDWIPNFEIYAESENGEVVNDAVYKRNLMISEKYNATISQQLELYPRDVLQETIMAGEDAFDLAIMPLEQISTCAVNGYFCDLKDTPNVDVTKSYWNQDANDQLEIMGKLVIGTSDFLLSDKRRINCLIYNPSLGEQYGIPSIVDSVRAGKWTADLMASYIKMAPYDLNGDSEMDETDQWGLAMDSYNAFAAFYYGFDNQIISTDETGNYTLTMNTTHSADSIDKVLTLVDKSCSFFCEDWSTKMDMDNVWSLSGDAFFSGRALFVTMFAQCFSELSEKTDFDYLVLPYPKYDESQEKYTTLADIYSELFGIPVTVEDQSFSGFMLEALSAAATDTSLYAYYDVACKTKYSYNEANSEMLDIVFDGVIYEKAMIYSIGNLYTLLSNNIPKFRVNKFAALYAKSEKKALKSLSDLLSSFAETYGDAES